MVIDINYKRILVICIVLGVFLTLSGAYASDVNATDTVQTTSEELPLIDGCATQSASFTEPASSRYVKGETFDVGVSYENGTGIAGKTVYFTVNGDTSGVLTDDKGIAKLKLNLNKGNYKISYKFNETGFNPIESSKSITLMNTNNPKIQASAYTAYVGVKNPFKVTLTVDGSPLAKRWVTFSINGVKKNVSTNSKGQATFNINLKKGTYWIYYSYAGEDKINEASGKSKITVKKGMPTKIIKANSLIYRHRTSAPIKVKLMDARNSPIPNAKVTFKINKKTYVRKTNDKGIATLNIKLPKGTYKVVTIFAKNSKYNKASKSFKIKVKPKQARNNGMWLLSTDMYDVNFDTLQKYGTKHIFLNAKAIERYGQSEVEKFALNAKNHGIKVHLWVQVFYAGGKWYSPVKNGKINYEYINSKINDVKKFSKVKNIGGIHFDYLRFPDGAYNYKNGVSAINYFTKHATNAVHKINPKLIVSAAVMPEPSSMKKHYGQDIPTMSKYLDVIVPMVYKGNYHAGTSWIKSVTYQFVKMSSKAKVWTGLQTYKSDEDWSKLPAGSLMNDADAAALGGARGVILFRYGLYNNINFNEV